MRNRSVRTWCTAMNLDHILFAWGANPYFGWGVVGINFMINWPGVALSVMPDPQGALPDGDPRNPLLADRITRSREWRAGLDLRIPTEANLPVFMGLGNDLHGHYPLSGMPTVAFPVFENVASVSAAAARLREYPIVITASKWNHGVLAELGIASTMVHQGYDPVLFHPGIRKPRTDGRFRVFSGGKAEYRKGQDLVLQGFKIFAEKHDDAVLHAAWASPWSFEGSFSAAGIELPPSIPGMGVNFSAWAQMNGIKRHQFELVPATPNHLMPGVLANMDCAVFASRFEGGTNIAAMECLGAGIPTVLSWSTGHKDLPYDWCFSDFTPEAIAALLQIAYDDDREARGDAPWPSIKHFQWPNRISELVEVLKDV
jgi:glycosyltransferase involved in cell wall biosynthesis